MHANPAVREALVPPLDGIANVRVVPPLSYGGFANLLAHAQVVLTDSGGIQEEAPALDLPVLVTRSTTERPEAVEAGAARLVGTDEAGRALVACDDTIHSGQVGALAASDGLVFLPAETDRLPQGALVRFLPFCTMRG